MEYSFINPPKIIFKNSTNSDVPGEIPRSGEFLLVIKYDIEIFGMYNPLP